MRRASVMMTSPDMTSRAPVRLELARHSLPATQRGNWTQRKRNQPHDLCIHHYQPYSIQSPDEGVWRPPAKHGHELPGQISVGPDLCQQRIWERLPLNPLVWLCFAAM